MASQGECEKCGGMALKGMRWCQAHANDMFSQWGWELRSARLAREKGRK